MKNSKYKFCPFEGLMLTTVALLTAVTLVFSASTLLVSCSGGDTPQKVVDPIPTPTPTPTPDPNQPNNPNNPTNPDQPSQPDQPTVPTLPENVEIVLNATSSAINKGSTRATTIDSNTDLQKQDLRIYAYFHDTETSYLSSVLSYKASAWKFWETSSEQHYYWPIEGSVYQGVTPITVSSLDFVGYCPITNPGYISADPTYNHSTGISFSANMESYMTSTAQSDVTEFMCALLPDQTVATQTAHDGALPLQFKHSFARILFDLSSTTTANVKVNSISIAELKTSGSCAFNGSISTWSDQSGSATMNLTEELQRGIKVATAPFLVIPNNYGSKNLSVNVTWTEWDAEKTQTYTAPLTINWEAGSSYTYTLTITKYELLVNVSKFTEQW